MAREVKMTAEHRHTAVAALLLHACAARCLELSRTEQLLGDRVYEERFSAEDRARMAELPAGWMPQVERIDANAGGWTAHLTYTSPDLTLEELVKVSMSNHRRLYIGEYGPGQIFAPAAQKPGWRFPHLVAGRTWPYPTHNVQDPALIQDLQAHLQTKQAWFETASELHRKLQSTIKSFKGLKAMLIAIPELKELAPSLEAAANESPKMALSPDVKTVMCAIAHLRGEERAGCCEEAAPEAQDAENQAALAA
jgi:hypothetical protein